MRRLSVLSAALLFACGGGTSSNSGSAGPSDGGSTSTSDAGSLVTDAGESNAPADAGNGATADAGTAGNVDAGTGGTGGGTIPDGGTAGGGSADAGTTVSDCDGLTPVMPGTSLQIQLTGQDLDTGRCLTGDVDGTGHIAVGHIDEMARATLFHFFDSTGIEAGTGGDSGLVGLIGQASGFMDTNCEGAACHQLYDVFGPTGAILFQSHADVISEQAPSNDPLGGMLILHIPGENAFEDVASTVSFDSIDPAGKIRWTYALPDQLMPADSAQVITGVDRAGNSLILWNGAARFGANTLAGQWLNHAGAAGPVFLFASGIIPGELAHNGSGEFAALTPRVGSGLLIAKFDGTWFGQIDPMSTRVSPVPAWLAARPNKILQMVHGGTGYAAIPFSSASGVCQAQVEVISPAGNSCGTATFANGGGTCASPPPLVGYDGTVLLAVPSAQDQPSCAEAGHFCNCTWHAWPGFFR